MLPCAFFQLVQVPQVGPNCPSSAKSKQVPRGGPCRGIKGPLSACADDSRNQPARPAQFLDSRFRQNGEFMVSDMKALLKKSKSW